jgi:hypothetical protein
MTLPGGLFSIPANDLDASRGRVRRVRHPVVETVSQEALDGDAEGGSELFQGVAPWDRVAAFDARHEAS